MVWSGSYDGKTCPGYVAPAPEGIFASGSRNRRLSFARIALGIITNRGVEIGRR
jgi:hypothetical protein